MAFYQLKRVQKFPVSANEIWNFIATPLNLKKITPPSLGFNITGISGEGKMYEGMIISYHVSPFLGIKMNWVTEITHIVDGFYFIDEQRIGPYAMWHHEHRIETVEGGVVMTDIVTYKPPLGFLGILAHHLFIKRKLRQIFDFRQKALQEIFGN